MQCQLALVTKRMLKEEELMDKMSFGTAAPPHKLVLEPTLAPILSYTDPTQLDKLASVLEL